MFEHKMKDLLLMFELMYQLIPQLYQLHHMYLFYVDQWNHQFYKVYLHQK